MSGYKGLGSVLCLFREFRVTTILKIFTMNNLRSYLFIPFSSTDTLNSTVMRSSPAGSA